ncbi:potassium transporter TrkG [Gordonia sp. LSe1-13]|uniref:Potassium transporter TrkG n=1 Tax=Gordonia sesuvii TaxID=3116777 RepID=A0ABU7ML74_9ACTN|nr:potassium transporter TrkG [Gordonia sp. LSe1-13]
MGLLGARHPARLVAAGFALAVVVGTAVLMLPIATESGESTSAVTALFTATSAVCVTGLVVVDTGSHWSMFGELTILTLIQVGGLGIMTLASMLGLIVARRMGLRMQLVAQAETRSVQLGDSRRVVIGVIVLSLAVEAVIAAILSTRFIVGYDENVGRGIYLGIFHAISAYNNAGFSLYADSLMPFASDLWILVPIVVGFVIGGLGFPVVFEAYRRLLRRLRSATAPARGWSLHTKITVITYAILAVAGAVAITAAEWSNPATLGPMGLVDKVTNGVFQGMSPRTVGFNSIDIGAMHPSSLLVTDMLMFIGGGSAGTAGGIKVTTFALLAFVVIAEIRGEPTVHVMGRNLAPTVQRQAITVVLLGVGAVVASTLAIMFMTEYRLETVLFEVVSAFATVGLSTGITADLPAGAQLLLVLLMFVGRLGPITLATALALRERGRRYEYPEERPIVG